MEDHPADELDVEGAHAEGTDGGFAHDGEGFLEQAVERASPGRREILFGDPLEGLSEPAAELFRPGPELLVGERLHARLERVDRRDARQELLDVPLVLRPEDPGEETVDHIWTENVTRPLIIHVGRG